MNVIYIIFIIIIVIKELIPLIKAKMKKESIIVSIALVCTLITIVGSLFNVPSIIAILYEIISPIAKSIFK